MEVLNKPDSAVESQEKTDGRALLSVVTPAYNEAKNLPLLYERLSRGMASLDVDWEWVVVDDHSADETFVVLGDIAKRNQRVHAIRFARN